MRVTMTIHGDSYVFDATEFGCDIFKNNVYINTVEGDQHDRISWIGRGVDFVVRETNETR